jgi:hypothetical protein
MKYLKGLMCMANSKPSFEIYKFFSGHKELPAKEGKRGPGRPKGSPKKALERAPLVNWEGKAPATQIWSTRRGGTPKHLNAENLFEPLAPERRIDPLRRKPPSTGTVLTSGFGPLGGKSKSKYAAANNIEGRISRPVPGIKSDATWRLVTETIGSIRKGLAKPTTRNPHPPSVRTQYRGSTMLKRGNPALRAMALKGFMPANFAEKIARMSPDSQRKVLGQIQPRDADGKFASNGSNGRGAPGVGERAGHFRPEMLPSRQRAAGPAGVRPGDRGVGSAFSSGSAKSRQPSTSTKWTKPLSSFRLR